MSELVGETLGHYRIAEMIGAGGMGEVYRARDEKLERDVAIKVLPEAVVRDAERLARFEREAKAVARLTHPNILEIHELGEHRDRPYMVTEVLDGESLSQRLRGSRLSWRRAAEIGAAIADGLAAAHRAGVIHRDLKPSNVFLTSDGRVKVIDFGLARIDEAVDQEADTVTHSPEDTQAGAVLGTVGYMAPEQVAGKPADARSDIFSLGCVLYELVSGVRAFKGNTGVETMNAILKQDQPEISSSEEAIPPELVGAIGRCLEKSPDARFQSASDLAYALRTVSAVRTPTGEVAAPVVGDRRRKGLWFAIAAVAVIAAAVGLIFWVPWQSPPELAIQTPEPAATPAPRPPQNRVVVLPFVNKTGDPAMDPLSHSLAAGVWRTVARVPEVDPVLMSAVDSALVTDHADPASAVVEAAGAGVAVSGSIFAEGDNLLLQAVVQDIISGHVRQPAEVLCDEGETSGCLVRLAARVAEIVELQVHVPQLLLMLNRLPSYEAYRAFHVDDDTDRGLSIDPAIGVMRRLYRSADLSNRGEWLEAAAAASSLLDDFGSLLSKAGTYSVLGQRALFEGDIPLSLSAHREACELEPSSLFFKAQLADVARAANRPREVIDVFADVAPCDNGYAFKIAYAHIHSVDFEAAAEAARTFEACFPAQWWLAEEAEVLALAALGRIDEMETAIERSLARPRGTSFSNSRVPAQLMKLASRGLLFHGDRATALSFSERALATYRKVLETWQLRESAEPTVDQELQMMEYLWRAGLEDEAVRLGSKLLESAPENREVVMGAGILAARRGDRVEAEKAAAVLAGTETGSEETYNLARIAAQLGDTDRALDLLRQYTTFGDVRWIRMRFDPDLEPLRNHPAFQEMLRPKS